MMDMDPRDGYETLAYLRSTPDPERDARVELEHARLRRRAAAEFDRYFDTKLTPTPAAADAALERAITSLADYVVSRLHHNSHYGVDDREQVRADGRAMEARATLLHAPGCRGAFGLPCIDECTAHKPDYVASRGWLIEHTDSHVPDGRSVEDCPFCPPARNPSYGRETS